MMAVKRGHDMGVEDVEVACYCWTAPCNVLEVCIIVIVKFHIIFRALGTQFARHYNHL